jgi:PLD-like domain
LAKLAALSERDPARVFQDLAVTPGVEIRTKRDHGAPMHLKSYQIDGRVLRTRAANFSARGLKNQDNDLIVIESAKAAEAFKREFDAQFSGNARAVLACQGCGCRGGPRYRGPMANVSAGRISERFAAHLRRRIAPPK